MDKENIECRQRDTELMRIFPPNKCQTIVYTWTSSNFEVVRFDNAHTKTNTTDKWIFRRNGEKAKEWEIIKIQNRHIIVFDTYICSA